MEIRREGRVVPVEQVRYREMGYRRPLSPGPDLAVFPVDVDVSVEELVGPLLRTYTQFMQEAKAELRDTEEYDPEFLEETGFIELPALIEQWPQHFSELVVDYLFFEVLGALISNAPGRPLSTVINAIESVQVFGDRVRLKCTGFEKRSTE